MKESLVFYKESTKNCMEGKFEDGSWQMSRIFLIEIEDKGIFFLFSPFGHTLRLVDLISSGPGIELR